MRHPSVTAEYVRTYHEEHKRLAAKSTAKRAHLELRRRINREIDRLVDAIAKGYGDPAILGPRSSLWTRSAENSRGIERRALSFRRYLPSGRPRPR
jgi:site-specific DNA recombinase